MSPWQNILFLYINKVLCDRLTCCIYTPAAANHTVDNLGCLHSHSSRPVRHAAPTTGKKVQHRRTKHVPRTTAPPRGMNRFGTYTTLSQTNRVTHVICMVLYHLHTRPPTLCKSDLASLSTLILIIVLLYLYSCSDKLYPTWWWTQQHWPQHVVDTLYTPDNIAALRLLYPYYLRRKVPLPRFDRTFCSLSLHEGSDSKMRGREHLKGVAARLTQDSLILHICCPAGVLSPLPKTLLHICNACSLTNL